MKIVFDTGSVESYRQFLKVKALPAYHMRGRLATFPDEYAKTFGLEAETGSTDYTPEPFLFDYQKAIVALAIQKRKFAVFADCGLGKSLILLSYARHISSTTNKRILIITPPMVVPQLAAEAKRFWGEDFETDIVRAAGLQEWLDGDGCRIGITNYEALKDETTAGNLGALILDESSILKSH